MSFLSGWKFNVNSDYTAVSDHAIIETSWSVSSCRTATSSNFTPFSKPCRFTHLIELKDIASSFDWYTVLSML